MRPDSTSSKCRRFCSKYFFFPLKKNSNHKCGCIYATALSDLTTRVPWIWDVSPWPHTTLWATEWIWIQLKPTTWGSGRVVINSCSHLRRGRGPRAAQWWVWGGLLQLQAGGSLVQSPILTEAFFKVELIYVVHVVQRCICGGIYFTNQQECTSSSHTQT